MDTVIDNLNEAADGLRVLVTELLMKHFEIYEWNRSDDRVVFLSASGNYAYRDLSDKGRILQAKLLEEYGRFDAILNFPT
jgi:hypothetical protein